MNRQQPMMPAQYRPNNFPQTPVQQRQMPMARVTNMMPHMQQHGRPTPQQRGHQQMPQLAQQNAQGPSQMQPRGDMAAAQLAHQQAHMQNMQLMQRGAEHHPPDPRAMMTERERDLLRSHEQQRVRDQQARNQAQRPTDFTLPDGIDEVVVGDAPAQYRRMRDFEMRLDAVMMRKEVEYLERIKRRSKHTRKMRVWISNTVDGQFWQTQPGDNFDFTNDNNGTYKVRVHGQLHAEPESDDSEPEALSLLVKPKRTRFSHFFSKITVQFDQGREVAPDESTLVEWVKPQGFVPNDSDELPEKVDFDHLVFERKGDESTNVTINLHRDFSAGDSDESNTVYKVSDELAAVIMMEEATRHEASEGVFDYVRAEGLQQDDERRIIRCDERLRKVFNMNSILFPQLTAILIDPKFKHLQPLKPISLRYTIRTDEEFHQNPEPTVYDVMVPSEDPVRERLVAMREQKPNWGQDLMRIRELDKQLALSVQATHQHIARWKFYNNLSLDPVNFIRKWANSQRRDLEVILGDTANETGWIVERGARATAKQPTLVQNYNLPGDEFRRGGSNSVWTSQGVREAVQLRLAKHSKVGGVRGDA